MKKVLKSFIVILFLITICYSTQAKYNVKFGVYVKHLAIQKSGFLFDANFYWWMKIPMNHEKTDTLDIWKNIEFTNAENVDVQIIERKIVGNEYLINGTAKGAFLYEANYRKYPFDSQILSIIVENTTDEKDECTMLPDSQAYYKNGFFNINKIIHDGIYLEGISIKGVKIKSNDGFYNSNFGDNEAYIQSTYSRLSFDFFVERHYFSYFLKLIIPLFIIVVLAYLVFFIPSSQLEVASSLTVTSLIAAVAFQITISDDIPTVGYTTSCDLIFYLSYTTIMIAMIQTIYTYNLEKKNRVALSQKIEKLGRWILPIFYLLTLTVIVVFSIL